jgi:hypothetical protein
MEWLIYLSKVSVCMGLFYAFYHFFLQKLTFFSLNRLYLLATLILSFVIPVLQLEFRSNKPVLLTETIYTEEHATANMYSLDAAPLTSAPIQSIPSRSELDWERVLNIVYWGIAFIILLVLLFQITTLLWHSRKVVARTGALKVVQKTGRFTNCSFLNYVFVDQNELDQEALMAVMYHESVHAARYHSVDKMFIGICKVLLWFSPPIYLYSRALEQTHEYEADKETSSLIGNAVYANLLLTLAVNNKNARLVHSFVKNPVKERIKMLFTNQSKNMKKLTYLTLVPTGLALVWLFGVQVVYAESKMNAKSNVPQIQKSSGVPSPSASTSLLKVKNPVLKKLHATNVTTESSKPLRLIDSFVLGEDPLVIIDGKKYTAEILTRISPACMEKAEFSMDKAVITTKNNRVEYATKAELETAKIRERMKSNGKFYSRYSVTIGGHKRDEVLIRNGNRFTYSTFPIGYRILLSMNGKVFTEKEAGQLPSNYAYDKTTLEYGYTDSDKELHSKYGDKYDLVIQFSQAKADLKEQSQKVVRGSMQSSSEDYFGMFVYSAKDSTIYSKDKQYLTLFGNAEIRNGQCVINADKIKMDIKARTVIAQNATFTLKGEEKPIIGTYVKVDLDKGTYELLSGTANF